MDSDNRLEHAGQGLNGDIAAHFKDFCVWWKISWRDKKVVIQGKGHICKDALLESSQLVESSYISYKLFLREKNTTNLQNDSVHWLKQNLRSYQKS